MRSTELLAHAPKRKLTKASSPPSITIFPIGQSDEAERQPHVCAVTAFIRVLTTSASKTSVKDWRVLRPAQSSTLSLLTVYLAGGKGQLAQSEQSQKTTKRGSVNLRLASEFHMSLFVSFGGNLTHGKSI
jgi:hypothetical protein